MSEPKMTTTDGRPVDEVRAEQQAEGSVGQHKSYIVLSDEERAKGFVRPVRRSYRHVGLPGPKHPLRELTAEERERHARFGYTKFEPYPEGSSITGRYWTDAQLAAVDKGCGTVTTMGSSIAETYARQPDFYGATLCVNCNRHLPVGEHGEFVWIPDGSRVGT